ncbi:MAG: glycoside hydrolase family 1 protein, partial [Chloroflexota bacterium]
HELLAHAAAVQAFRAGGYGPGGQPGRIGIVLDVEDAFPAGPSDADQAACRRYTQHYSSLFADPLFKGHYPQELIEWLGPMAPKIQPGDLEQIRQPVDFLGINYYRGMRVSYDTGGGHLKCRAVNSTEPLWGYTELGWGMYPSGLTNVLRRFKDEYGNPPLYITENGTATPDQPDASGFVNDTARVNYLRGHILACHDALQTGVDLRGYFVWSLLDNFEWAEGYAPRFGLVRVDYETLKRTPKRSFAWYGDVIARCGLED